MGRLCFLQFRSPKGLFSFMSEQVKPDTALVSETRSINGHLIDMAQIVAREIREGGVTITVRNGDKITFNWRDKAEQDYLFKELKCR
jgi:hypothetical protein